MVGFPHMLRAARFATGCSLLAFMLTCCGCGDASSDNSAADGSATAETDGAEADGHSHEGHSHEGDGDDGAGVAKLSAEDQALADAQKVCVVSGAPLGSMGTPIKVEHDGEIAFLCCSGCTEAFESDPESYLAKLEGGGGADAESADPGSDDAAADPPADGN